MYNVGLDVGEACSSVEILDSCGKHVKHLEVKGRWNVLLDRIEKEVPRPFAICFEASCGYGYLHDRLSKICARVEVAHPGQTRLIFRSKKKHNRIDAEKLAKLLYLDEVPRAHVPSGQVRSWRATIEWRQRLLAKLVSIKNQLRAMFKSQGIQKLEGIGARWTKKGLAWIAALELSESEALRRDIMLDEIHRLGVQIKRVESYLKKVSDRHPGVALLMTIPGVGIRTAEAFCAYVDEIWRFRRIKCVGSYFGMIPCQDATGKTNRLGHITREGPATVRKLLTEAAWQSIRHSSTIKNFFERVRHDDPNRRKIALVATGHYLARVMTAMLRSGECWRHEQKKNWRSEREKKIQHNREEKDGLRPAVEGSPLRKTPDA
jgi:transposase